MIKNLSLTLIGKIAARHGYEVVKRHRPALSGLPTILGSFPPLNEWCCVGSRENYFIHDGYCHRTKAAYFDDTANEDQWQLEVYQFAREICEREGLSTVADIGCGSAYKLMRYFSQFMTVGIDVPRTCSRLRARWPDRKWVDTEFGSEAPFRVDLVIASDLIEHLLNPDELLLYIQTLRPKYVVLSTPDRNLVRYGTHNGPPMNVAHIREWGFAEFRTYIQEFFDIEAHFISCPAQATQCVLCRP